MVDKYFFIRVHCLTAARAVTGDQKECICLKAGVLQNVICRVQLCKPVNVNIEVLHGCGMYVYSGSNLALPIDRQDSDNLYTGYSS